jgi:hypothetical protein
MQGRDTGLGQSSESFHIEEVTLTLVSFQAHS